MSDTNKCRKCGKTTFIEKEKGPHIGLYCESCGAWLKWKHQKDWVSVKETVKEYQISEGEEVLIKKKVAHKIIPPDITAAKMLIENFEEESLSRFEVEDEGPELKEPSPYDGDMPWD